MPGPVCYNVAAAGYIVELNNSVNVLQGAYRDDNGKPVVLDVVRQAEDIIAGSNFME